MTVYKKTENALQFQTQVIFYNLVVYTYTPASFTAIILLHKRLKVKRLKMKSKNVFRFRHCVHSGNYITITWKQGAKQYGKCPSGPIHVVVR